MISDFKLKISADNQSIVEIDRFKIEAKKINFLFGESGIGKSLISKTILSLVHPIDLTIELNNESYLNYIEAKQTRELLENSCFVFQEPSSHLNPRLTLNQQLNEAAIAGEYAQDEILNDLWNDDDSYQKLIDLYPSTNRPSGGEKQRFLNALAFKKYHRWLASDSDDALFIFDEATGSLDERARNLCINHLFKLYKEKAATILIITHDYALIDFIHSDHKSLTKKMVFKQLERTGDQIVHTDFITGNFLSWQKTLKPFKADAKVDKTILKMNVDVQVFGKKLQIQQKGKPVNLTIKSGQLIYLKANSGVGKTTIAKIIMGLVTAEKFEFECADSVYNQSSKKRRWRQEIWGKKVTMQFQHADEALNLRSNVLSGFRLLNSNLSESDLINYLSGLFNHVDINLLKKPIRLLSGGQKQRINILRSFYPNSQLVIMDEPLNGLDFRSVQRVLEFMKKQLDNGRSILLISHNESIFDRIVKAESVYQLVETSNS